MLPWSAGVLGARVVAGPDSCQEPSGCRGEVDCAVGALTALQSSAVQRVWLANEKKKQAGREVAEGVADRHSQICSLRGGVATALHLTAGWQRATDRGRQLAGPRESVPQSVLAGRS